MLNIKKGTMVPVKQGLGAALVLAGLGLVIFPDKTAEILCNYKMVTGAVISISGYFLFISGRRN